MRKIVLAFLIFLSFPVAAMAATGTIILPVQAVKLPSTSPVAIDAGETNWRLLFDDTTDESGQWQFRIPQNYSSGLTIKIQYSMASATTGAVYFEASVMAVTDGDAADINTESYDTANSGNATVPGTAGYLDEISITLTNADSVAAGDYVKIKINRDANNASDTAAGDAEVVATSLEYTTN